MFVTRKTFDREMELKDKQFMDIWDWYFDLSHKHNDLLKHFGLKEVKIPGTTEIRKIK